MAEAYRLHLLDAHERARRAPNDATKDLLAALAMHRYLWVIVKLNEEVEATWWPVPEARETANLHLQTLAAAFAAGAHLPTEGQLVDAGMPPTDWLCRLAIGWLQDPLYVAACRRAALAAVERWRHAPELDVEAAFAVRVYRKALDRAWREYKRRWWAQSYTELETLRGHEETLAVMLAAGARMPTAAERAAKARRPIRLPQ